MRADPGRLPDALDAVAHLRPRKDPERGRNPRLGYLYQSRREKNSRLGSGTAKEGALLYVQKGCAGCHGANGIRRPCSHVDQEAKTRTRRSGPPPCLAPCVNDESASDMAVHSPFATTIWDYINRGMPIGKEGTLTPNEVYSLTAFLLYKNDVIKEDEVMDAQSSAESQNAESRGFALPPEWKHGTPRLQGYP